MLLPALAIALMVGCVRPQRVQPLDEAIRTYNDGVRWMRLELAASQVPATERDRFLDERDQLGEDLRISDYEVIRVRHDQTGRRARVQLKFTWHLDSRGVVHQTHTVQSWQRSGHQWILVGERHFRGEPMPGVQPGGSKDAPKKATRGEGEDGDDALRQGPE